LIRGTGLAVMTMVNEQAKIAVQKSEVFEQLRSALDRIFASPALEKFLSGLENKGVRAREFEKIAGVGLLEKADSGLARGGKSAQELYQALALSDRALLREFYLERIENVDPRLRLKYQKAYRYY
jgi:hypothetical protein